MNTTIRYIILVFTAIFSIHLILSLTHNDYGRATSLSRLTSKLKGSQSQEYIVEHHPPPELAATKRANATFVILARNSDTDGIIRSIRDMEDRFNKYYQYPYVFLNDLPFTSDFKRRVSVLTDAKVEFGLIQEDHWHQPKWINETKAFENREKLVADNVIYGGSVSYRNMCRFNSGFFFKHELLQNYRWYWRIEPDVHFHCDVTYDPFVFMEEHDKVYGFTITMYEYLATIPTLWGHVKDFIKKEPQFVSPSNAMDFLSDDGGETFNKCHFWSNFEIADMDFWRGPAYTAFFDYLESTGGFYYERWGDAPVHSIGAALLARKDQIHFFGDMGYEHNPYVHCPKDDAVWKRGKCGCNQARSFDYDGYSCMKQWERANE